MRFVDIRELGIYRPDGACDVILKKLPKKLALVLIFGIALWDLVRGEVGLAERKTAKIRWVYIQFHRVFFLAGTVCGLFTKNRFPP